MTTNINGNQRIEIHFKLAQQAFQKLSRSATQLWVYQNRYVSQANITQSQRHHVSQHKHRGARSLTLCPQLRIIIVCKTLCFWLNCNWSRKTWALILEETRDQSCWKKQCVDRFWAAQVYVRVPYRRNIVAVDACKNQCFVMSCVNLHFVEIVLGGCSGLEITLKNTVIWLPHLTWNVTFGPPRPPKTHIPACAKSFKHVVKYIRNYFPDNVQYYNC